jgi:hypothetical protein
MIQLVDKKGPEKKLGEKNGREVEALKLLLAVPVSVLHTK